MDVNRLIAESTRKDGTLDLKLLGQKRVMVMPQGLRPLLTEIFTKAGLAALLQSESLKNYIAYEHVSASDRKEQKLDRPPQGDAK